MNICVGKRAAGHIAAIYEWYEQQQPGFGIRFLNEFEKVLAVIREQPDAGVLFRIKTRKVLVRVFPYKVFYTVSKNQIMILAFFHHRKKGRTRK